MFSNLLGKEGVWHQFYQVVNGVDAGMDRLEPLDLLSDCQGVCHVGRHVVLMVRHHYQSQLQLYH